jgi:hypothetical protein
MTDVGYRFNPPPNWPLPPDWSPPLTWRPDPHWPDPPPGWQVWIDEEADEEELAEIAVAEAHDALPPGGAFARAWDWLAGLPIWGKALVAVLCALLLPLILVAGGVGLLIEGAFAFARGGRWKLRSKLAALAAVAGGLAAAAVGTALAVAVRPHTEGVTAGIFKPAEPPPAPTRFATGAADTPLAATPVLPSGPTAVEPASPEPSPEPSREPSREPSGSGSTGTATPTPARPAAKPTPTPTPDNLCGAPDNPYGYNFCGRGGLLFEPAGDICSFLRCDDAFWQSDGYLVECADHAYALSGGEPDACADHNGIMRPLYQGP